MKPRRLHTAPARSQTALGYLDFAALHWFPKGLSLSLLENVRGVAVLRIVRFWAPQNCIFETCTGLHSEQHNVSARMVGIVFGYAITVF